jgi:hypothetical protein
MRALLNRPLDLRGDEIAVWTRQNANMTLSQLVPVRAFYKTFHRAATLNRVYYRQNLSHVNLMRYQFVTVHGTHCFIELRGTFYMLMWIWGVPSE